MNQKLNLQELINLLAEKSNITKREAEVFLKEYMTTVSDALLEDKNVKIKNFGTLKLIVVNERASVNVTTGERSVIPAHYKVNFTPDSQLASTVNEPFALFESVELQSELIEENDKAEETPEIIEPETEDIIPEVIEKEEEVIETTTNESDYTNNLEYIHNEKEEEMNKKEEIEEEVILEEGRNYYGDVKENRKKTGPNWFLIISAILLLAMAGVFVFVHWEEKRLSENSYLFPQDTIMMPAKNDLEAERNDQEAEETEAIQEISQAIEPEKAATNAKPEKEEVTAPAVNKQEATIIPKAIVSNENNKTVKVGSGETLRTIAEKELGSKDFWVYIYLKNKETIKNPNIVPVGTQLIIPGKSEFGGINANDSESIQKARNASAKVL